LPKNKNNKASSLTNLFRNQGGSFGIAFVTTILERRTQFHRTVLASHVTSSNVNIRNALAAFTSHFVQSGFSLADASLRAMAQIKVILERQAAFLAFQDCFWLLGVIAFCGPVLALFIRKFRQDGGGAAH
jgi:DHA2 family multidrug resistance protein